MADVSSDAWHRILRERYTPARRTDGSDELEDISQKPSCCTVISIAHNLNKEALEKVSAILTVLEIRGY